MCKYNIDDIKRELSRLGKENNFPCENIPVTISNMQRCLGYIEYKRIRNKIVPTKFNFAKRLIDGYYTENSIWNRKEYTHLL